MKTVFRSLVLLALLVAPPAQAGEARPRRRARARVCGGEPDQRAERIAAQWQRRGPSAAQPRLRRLVGAGQTDRSRRAGRRVRLGRPEVDGLSRRARPDRGRLARRTCSATRWCSSRRKGRRFAVTMEPRLRPGRRLQGQAVHRRARRGAGRHLRQAEPGEAGLVAALQGRIVGTDDVRTALAFVERGECGAGIVYATDARISDKVEVVAAVSRRRRHAPIVYPFALVARRAAADAAPSCATCASPQARGDLPAPRLHRAEATDTPCGCRRRKRRRCGSRPRSRCAPPRCACRSASRWRGGWSAAVSAASSWSTRWCSCRWCCRRWCRATCCCCCSARRGRWGSWLQAQFGIVVAFTWKGAVLASAVMAFPLMVQPIRLAFRLIDARLEHAAATLGARPWRVFATITLPLAAAGPRSPAACCASRAASANSARPWPSSATSPARRARCRWRSTASRTCPTAKPARCGSPLLSIALAVAALLVSHWISAARRTPARLRRPPERAC